MTGTVAVTGAAGHIGGNLVRSLLARGRTVRVVLRRDARAIEGLPVERVRADTLDPVQLQAALAGAKVVYHLAARVSILAHEDAEVLRTNVEGTRNVVAACLACGVRRLVHFSSIHARRSLPLAQPVDEARDLVDPRRALAYDRSKAAGELAVLDGVEQGLDAVIVCPTGVIGPNDHKPSRMGELLLDLYRGRLPALVRGGFDWVDARDVARGALAAEERGRRGERYLLSGHWASARELAALVASLGGAGPPRWTCPMAVARLAAPPATWLARIAGTRPLFTPAALEALRWNRCISSEKAERELGFAPRPLVETVADTLQWFREAGRI